MGKLQHILFAQWLSNIQVQNEPSFQRFLRVEISRDMNVVVALGVNWRPEGRTQDILTELFPDFDMAPLWTAIYIGDTGIDNYPCGMRVHINGDQKQDDLQWGGSDALSSQGLGCGSITDRTCIWKTSPVNKVSLGTDRSTYRAKQTSEIELTPHPFSSFLL